MNNIEKSVNPKVQNANRLSQFFQIFTLLSLVLSFYGYVLIKTPFRFSLWIIVWLSVGGISFLLAVRFQSIAIFEYRKARFNFSSARLHTLQVLKTPLDVMAQLKKLKGTRLRDEGELIAKLKRMMGSERCEEMRATIFKYTKVD